MKWIISVLASLISMSANANHCKISAVINDNQPEDQYLKIIQKKLGNQFATNPNDADYLLKITFEKIPLNNSMILARGLIGNYSDSNYYPVKGRGLAFNLPLYPGIPLGITVLAMKKMALKNMLSKVPDCQTLLQHFSSK